MEHEGPRIGNEQFLSACYGSSQFPTSITKKRKKDSRNLAPHTAAGEIPKSSELATLLPRRSQSRYRGPTRKLPTGQAAGRAVAKLERNLGTVPDQSERGPKVLR